MFYPGQKYRPSASRENEIDRLLRDARADSGSYSRGDLARMPMGHIMAKNESGADLGFAKAAMYYFDRYRTGTNGANDWDMRKDYVLLAPFNDVISYPIPSNNFYGGMAVTLEPIANNEFGRVAVAGLAILAEGSNAVNPVYLAPFTAVPKIRSTYWGYARVLADDPSYFSLVDLSDRNLTTQYVLTSNMSAPSNGDAAATLGGGASVHTWSTRVYDPHSLAGFQRTGDKGWCHYIRDRWVVTVPFCT